MAYSTELRDQLQAYFDSAKINATFREEGAVGIFSLRLKLTCKLQSAAMLVLVRENNFSTLIQLPLAADENSRLAVAEYLTRANYNMRNGNFELSMETGEIRFKSYVCTGTTPLDPMAAQQAILLPFMLVDRFGNGLCEVLFGFRSPREAFEAATKA